jgi:hypothetical protein
MFKGGRRTISDVEPAGAIPICHAKACGAQASDPLMATTATMAARQTLASRCSARTTATAQQKARRQTRASMRVLVQNCEDLTGRSDVKRAIR